MSLELPPLPATAGAYRWLYADVVAGDYTCVCIFMLGAPFSAKYSARSRAGGLPLQHSAVNLALYHRGRRKLWVLSEYPAASIDDGWLKIGRSRLHYCAGGALEIEIDDRPAPFGRRLTGRLTLVPEVPAGDPLRLSVDEPHHWSPLAARGPATIELPSLGLSLSGHGYHDTNWGEVMLGSAVPRWRWSRVHGPASTRIRYELPGQPPILVDARGDELTVTRGLSLGRGETLTGWGLKIPDALGDEVRRESVLESSPFYARLEGRHGDRHALAEVADFRRFHSPLIRWMARFRTRHEVIR